MAVFGVVMDISITDTTTGETRAIQWEDCPPDEWPTFDWTEGNWSCDCNREIEFHRAIGVEIDQSPLVCGHGRFTVVLKQSNMICAC